MKILKLKIKNFTSFNGSHVIDFEKLSQSQLFSITGPTGSGKSSILNAISIALYGKSYKTNLSQIDYISMNQSMAEVELEFSIGAEKYLSKWKAQKNKKDGTPLKNPITKRKFYSNNEEIESSIEELTGLDYQQFCKTVILNQGQFSKYLKSNYKDRKEILEKLYHEEYLKNISSLLRMDIKEALEQVNTLKTKQETLKESITRPIEEFTFELGELQKQEIRLTKESDKLNLELKNYNDCVSLLKQVIDLSKKAETEKINLKKEQDEYNKFSIEANLFNKENKTFIDNYEKTLEELESKINKLEKLDSYQKQFTDTEMDFAKTNTLINEYKTKLKNSKLPKPPLTYLDKSALSLIYKWLESTSQIKDNMASIKLKITQDKDLITDSIAETNELKKQITLKTNQLKAVNFQNIKEQLDQNKKKLIENEFLKKELNDSIAKAQKDLEYMEVAEPSRLQESLVFLAKEIVNNNQSQSILEQIHKTSGTILDSFKRNDIKDHLTKTKDSLNHLLTESKNIKNIVSQHEVEIAKLDKSLQHLDNLKYQLASEDKKYVAHTLSLKKLEGELLEFCEKLYAINQRDEFKEILHIVKEKEDIKEIYNDNRFYHLKRDEKVEIEKNIKNNQATLTNIAAKLNSLNEVISTLKDYSSLKKEDLLSKKQKTIDRYKALSKRTEELQEIKHQLNLKKSHTEQSIDLCQKSIEEAKLLLNKNHDYIDTTITYAENLNIISKLVSIHMERQEKLQLASKEVQLNIGNAKANIEHINKTKKEIDQLDKKIKEINTKNSSKNTLYLLIGKDQLRSYILNHIEEQIIMLANKELQGIYQGRYEISLSKDLKEFTIRDHFNSGEPRKVSTLSGGETFLVSLALALALSEMSKGEAELESFFIDEGFGSLDAQSLQEAIDALRELTLRGKNIGVISHVESLNDQINSQLQLNKDNSGNSSFSIVT